MERSLTATLKYALSSDKKINLIAKLIKGKPVFNVMNTLEYTQKKSAKILLKVVKSAIANAKNNLQLDENNLYIKSIYVGKGPKIKRGRFVGRSRVHSYIKHRSFVKVILEEKK